MVRHGVRDQPVGHCGVANIVARGQAQACRRARSNSPSFLASSKNESMTFLASQSQYVCLYHLALILLCVLCALHTHSLH